MPVAVNADSLAIWFLPAPAAAAFEHTATFDVHQEDQDHTVRLLRGRHGHGCRHDRGARRPGLSGPTARHDALRRGRFA
jgi:hypothetical protein